MLSDEEKADYKKRGEESKILIQPLKGNIILHKELISGLEKKIEELIPATPNGEIYCEKCGVKSIKFTGYKENFNRVYECELCGEMFLDEINKYM